MAVLKEWECIEHGTFEGTHPICPAMGCRSESVERVFLTAPVIKHDKTKRFDLGIRKTADSLQTTNLKSARPGEVSFGGRAEPKSGMQLLWGDETKQALGKSFAEMTQAAHKPLTITRPDGKVITDTRNNGMRAIANETKITQRVLPRAVEVAVADKSDTAKAKAMTA